MIIGINCKDDIDFEIIHENTFPISKVIRLTIASLKIEYI